MNTRNLLWLLLPLMAACASSSAPYNKPKDAIRAEMAAAAQAAASAPAPAGPGSELYPSMRLDMPQAVQKALEPRFDLVVNDAPARQVFLSMVADTRYSMLLPNDLEGSITVSLKDVTLPEALAALQQLYGYEYRIQGNRVFIQSRGLQTRIMKVNYLNAVRRGGSDIRVISGSVGDSTTTTSGSQSGSTSSNQTAFVTSKISTTGQSDFWSELAQVVKSIVGDQDGRSVVVSPQSGVLVVRATPGELAQVESFLTASQLSLERQVIIEAKIVEVTLSDTFQAGINWAAFGGNRITVGQLTPGSRITQSGSITTAPISSNPLRTLENASDAAGAMFGAVLHAADFSAVINLLEQQGQVHVLSSPRVATLNNQKAVLKVGNDDFFVTEVSTNSSTNSNGSTNVSPKLTLQPFFSGISLDVTPQIDEVDQITLHIHPMVSKVKSVTQEIDLGSLGKFKLPLASSQISEMDSVVKALDGQMVALGGLIRQTSGNTDSQVPGVGEVPLVGNLFKQQSRDSERRELVILLRPTVIQAASSWADDITRSDTRVQRLLDERGTSGSRAR
ncbi:pilus (MSHA type) biogenesis protein MshL [Uliginosibacterium sp. 31-16]|uniref:pilus (MSHA type) biogenesis protein MshL n=1 Tax=Uliginosibacterium sp. 31-16 TaxID=3068315 RepID=UPI00273F7658|nr:pilus (MSHA type) biogenesis protein MshL [Uliginosibacterium sp. 31-16]MDP5240244.1 pilus (MSHA type) biogenesis protein MshL [Uliginosibacterium sp. 31-16]